MRPLSRSLVSLALAAALSAATATSPVLAQPADAAPAQPVNLSIPAQPLGSALNELARQASLPLLFSPELVAGRSAPELNGSFTVREALARLLAGSGLVAAQEGRALVIQAAPRPGAATGTALPTITVEGRRERDGTTEGAGYAATAVTMFGPATSLKEIPSSISVLTRQQMDDQSVTTIIDALRYTTGVATINYSGQSGGAGSTAYYNSRGFPINASLDGLSIVNGLQYRSQFDMAMYDRAEVFRGPSGLIDGQGSLGGSINLVRKKPTDAFQFRSETSVGSWAAWRQMLDVSGPLNADASLRGRAVGVVGRANAFLDGERSRQGMGYGVLEYDLTPRTTATVSASYQSTRSDRTDWGVGYDSDGNLVRGPRGRSQNFGPDWARAPTTISEVDANLKHRFDNGWSAEATVLSRRDDWNAKYAFALTPLAGANTADYVGQRQHGVDEWQGIDIHVSGPVTVLGRRQDLLFGVSHSGYRSRFDGGSEDLGSFDIFAPRIPEPAMPYTSGTRGKTDQSSLYGRLNSRLTDSLSLVLGGRAVSYSQKSRDTAPTDTPWTTDAKASGKFVPYGGLVFALNPQISAYTSYSKILSMQTDRTVTGAAVEPFTGEQYELGLKGGFLQNRLNASVAAFRINGDNLAVADSLNPGFSVATGAVRTQGWEAELSGSPSPNWNLIAGYALTNTEYTASPTLQGQAYDGETPKNLFKLWSTYRFTGNALDGLLVGGGLYYQSSTWRLSERYRQGGYTIHSARLGYRFNRHIEADLMLKNLFDKAYYTRAPSRLFAEYGAPRSAMLTLRVSY